MEHEQPDTAAEDGPDEAGPAEDSTHASTPIGGGRGQEEALTAAGAALSDAVGSLLRIAAERGRRSLGRAAMQGRARMEMRQLQKDRTRMTEKLGREVIRLVEGGELDHPGLLRGVDRIREQDARIAESARNQPVGEDGEQKNVDPSAEVK